MPQCSSKDCLLQQQNLELLGIFPAESLTWCRFGNSATIMSVAFHVYSKHYAFVLYRVLGFSFYKLDVGTSHASQISSSSCFHNVSLAFQHLTEHYIILDVLVLKSFLFVIPHPEHAFQGW